MLAVIANAIVVLMLQARSRDFSCLSRVAHHVLVVLLGWYAGTDRISQLEEDVHSPRFYGERVIVDGSGACAKRYTLGDGRPR